MLSLLLNKSLGNFFLLIKGVAEKEGRAHRVRLLTPAEHRVRNTLLTKTRVCGTQYSFRGITWSHGVSTVLKLISRSTKLNTTGNLGLRNLILHGVTAEPAAAKSVCVHVLGFQIDFSLLAAIQSRSSMKTSPGLVLSLRAPGYRSREFFCGVRTIAQRGSLTALIYSSLPIKHKHIYLAICVMIRGLICKMVKVSFYWSCEKLARVRLPVRFHC